MEEKKEENRIDDFSGSDKKNSKVPPKRRFLFSIKYKLMIIMSLLLLSTVAIIIRFASDLIVKDKTTYIYDLSSSIAKTFSQQLDIGIQGKVDRIEDFISSYTIAREKDVLEKRFLNLNPDLINLNIYRVERQGKGSRFTNEKQIFNHLHYDSLVKKSIDELRNKKKIKLSSIVKNSKILNSTFSRDFSIYTLAFSSKKISNIIVIADYKDDFFKSLFSQTDIYDPFLVSTSGELISHSSVERLFVQKDVSDLGIVKQMMGESGTRGVTEYLSSDGVDMLGAFSLLPNWEVGVVIEVPKEFAFIGARNLITNIVKIVGVIFLASLIFVIIFSRTISNPIIRLSGATRDIAEGKFKSKLKSSSSDEIGHLAEDFNVMAVKLDELTKQIIQSAKMASIGSMARSIGHEFGNILGAIIGHADLISIEKNLDGAKKRAGIIIDGAERANMIVKNLKGISKSEEKLVKDEQIFSVLKSVIILAEPDYKKRGLTIETDYQKDNTVLIDQRQVSQVFLNMFINAGHAMKNGGKMHITVTEDHSSAIILFKDDGCGIPPENMKKIFEPLFTTKGDIGTGLGLAVSKKIVEEHGGTIDVTSVINEGTTFTIKIPKKA